MPLRIIDDTSGDSSKSSAKGKTAPKSGAEGGNEVKMVKNHIHRKTWKKRGKTWKNDGKTTENRPNIDRTSAAHGLRIPSEVVRERAEHAAPGLLRHQAGVRELLHGLGGHLAA